MNVKKEAGIYEAILKFQEKDRKEKTNAENPYFNSEYVTLDKIWDDVRTDLQELGLAVVQNPVFENGLYGVESIIIHVQTGQEIKTKLIMPIAKNDPQGVGSAITYARRYCLASQLGLTVDTDDDGNASVKQPAKPPVKQDNKPLHNDYIDEKVTAINIMLAERFGDNPDEIKNYVLKLTTWTDKENKVHKGIDSPKQIKTEKQAKFLHEKIKKDYQDWMNSINAGQPKRQEKKPEENLPF